MSELASTRQMGDGSSGDSGVTGRERRIGRERKGTEETERTEKIRMIFEAMDKRKNNIIQQLKQYNTTTKTMIDNNYFASNNIARDKGRLLKQK